jgi:outer membrane protein OmpA-like peptidoglycan-associated protein
VTVRTSLACTALGVLLLLPTSASAATASDQPAVSPGALGLGSTVVRVESAVRMDDGLRLSLVLSNPTDDGLQIATARPFFGPDGFSGVGVIDPDTGRYATVFRTQECRCAELPVFLDGGDAVSFAVDVADPGGDVVDVVFAAFQPVRGVAVQGDGDPADDPEVTQLQPRSIALQPRTDQGAVTVQGKQVALDTDVLFALGSASLTPAAGADLDRAAAVLRDQPARRIGVEGHTDSQGEDAFNQQLSEQRAQTVRDGLAVRLGPGWTFEVQGFGETRPVAPETTETGSVYAEGQARNRRVELRVLPG